jgi:hypothetical protein
MSNKTHDKISSIIVTPYVKDYGNTGKIKELLEELLIRIERLEKIMVGEND